ncbi:MAG: FAD-dependent 5-carboxymethylaminomethyl-2-thiouridine(34) oxidoreductase MnmC, partial [Pseudomonadota bacterium]|nr:FAD-dependent 5-carboxymethylaminomethyl-2-thiouridine(34) oxidoreductase MnmC [Pseudomonadota bacterium]
ASNVRAALHAAGFETAKCPGFGRKRHMLSGQLSHHYKKKAAYPTDKKSKQHAAIIGAGLAGSALTESLARRGWEIDLFEQNAQIAQGASGNSAGILMPLLSRDDNTASKLTRAGFLYTRQQAIRLEALGMNPGFNACGVMLCARNEKEESDFSALTAPFSWPEAFVQPINQSQGSCLAGWPLPAGGLYFPQAGTISPRHYCQALLRLYPNQVHHHFNCIVMTVKRINQSWYLYDKSGQIICCAPVLIMANAAGTVKMGLDMPIKAIRGQISSLPAVNRHAPKLALCNRGYVTPQIDHYIHFGATYDEIDDPDISLSSHSENFDRLNELMPGFVHDPMPWGQVEGRVAFRAVSPDRLPLVGPIASPQPIKPGTKNQNIQREPGLYTLTGLGSRGLAWAPLCAEIIACSLNHEPAPIEKKLIQALDPVRFALRKANHQS